MSDSLQLLLHLLLSPRVRDLCFIRKWLQVQCCVSSENGFKFSGVFHQKMVSSLMLCFIRNMAMRVLRLCRTAYLPLLIISLFIMVATLFYSFRRR